MEKSSEKEQWDIETLLFTLYCSTNMNSFHDGLLNNVGFVTWIKQWKIHSNEENKALKPFQMIVSSIEVTQPQLY